MKMSNLKRGLSERDKVIVDRLDKLQRDQKDAMNVQRTRHRKKDYRNKVSFIGYVLFDSLD